MYKKSAGGQGYTAQTLHNDGAKIASSYQSEFISTVWVSHYRDIYVYLKKTVKIFEIVRWN